MHEKEEINYLISEYNSEITNFINVKNEKIIKKINEIRKYCTHSFITFIMQNITDSRSICEHCMLTFNPHNDKMAEKYKNFTKQYISKWYDLEIDEIHIDSFDELTEILKEER